MMDHLEILDLNKPMTLLSVYHRVSKVGVNEQCVRRSDGDFIGVKSGTWYPEEQYYARPQTLARIERTDFPELTGMIHLDDVEGQAKRRKFKGCTVVVEQAHDCGIHTVYFSPDVKDYFADCELTFLNQ